MRSVSIETGDYINFVVNKNIAEYCRPIKEELAEYLDIVAVKSLYDYICRIEFESKRDKEVITVNIEDNVDRLKLEYPDKEVCLNKEEFIIECKEDFNNLCATLLVNGLDVRVVYYLGRIVKAVTCGIDGREVDLTDIILQVLGEYNSTLEGYGLVELRGKLTNIENTNLTTIENIISLIENRECDKMIVVVYDMFCDSLSFSNRHEMLWFLDTKCGLKVPDYWNLEYIAKEDILSAVEQCSSEIEEIYKDNYEFESNFIEWRVGNKQEGKKLLIELNKSMIYESVVKEVYWFDYKPFAIIEEVTIGDSKIDNIPLYTPANILKLESYKGNNLKFIYEPCLGGIACDKRGKPLFKDFIGDYILS